jgi:hypothetical protein
MSKASALRWVLFHPEPGIVIRSSGAKPSGEV